MNVVTTLLVKHIHCGSGQITNTDARQGDTFYTISLHLYPSPTTGDNHRDDLTRSTTRVIAGDRDSRLPPEHDAYIFIFLFISFMFCLVVVTRELQLIV